MLPGVGVFGTSLTARVIIPLLKDEGFAVKALWGRTQEEAEELAKEMSVPFYTSRIDEVLLHQDVDLVCINLPPPLTRQIAVKTLELGHQRKKKQQAEKYWGKNATWFCLAELLLPPAPPRETFVYPHDAALGESWGTGFKPLGMQPV
uniref:Gfo/Idh/MocA-like oxidoreductase domain containing 1 n=1 Tax=Saimiri boliviensis boliviensis TaxID=39432 RepID=A0A2K6TIZ7_SAIBB